MARSPDGFLAMDDQWSKEKLIALVDSVSVLPISHGTLDNLRTYRAQIQSGTIQTDDQNYVIALCQRLLRQQQNKLDNSKDIFDDDQRSKIIVRTYSGSHDEAVGFFKIDATSMAAEGYFPISENWTARQWETRAFVIAALLIFLFGLGILILGYMLIVKPKDGSLTVTYELRAVADEKTCPMCAERIKAAALVCHFCGHKFATADQIQVRLSQHAHG
jgi:hypothetical protein